MNGLEAPCSSCKIQRPVVMLVQESPDSVWWAIYCDSCASVLRQRLTDATEGAIVPSQSNGKITKGDLTVLVGGKA
jgi:hypothetical protein